MLFVKARPRGRRNAGFTLVELMAVVVITGILATLAIALVRNHINAAKSNRGLAGMQAIRVAEEAFRAQNGRYMNCSRDAGGTTWYPAKVPTAKIAYDWRQDTHPDWEWWRALGVINDAPTQYGFLANAGLPGEAYPELFTAKDPTLPASTKDWYVIQAKGDLDGDGTFFQGIITSTSGFVYVEREGE